MREYIKNSIHTFTTSGTTGHPKQVQHSQEFLDEVSQANIDLYGHTKKSKLLNYMAPMSIGTAVMMDNVQRMIGCEVLHEKFNPFTFIDYIHEVRPTFMVMPPNMWRVLSKMSSWQKLDMSSFDCVSVGGDFTANGMLHDIARRGAKKVLNVYGSTEVPPPVLYSYGENHYSRYKTPDGVSMKFSDRRTLMCKWDSQGEWWDSEDLVEGKTVWDFHLKGRERNMFKQDNVRVYPEEVEKTAIHYGASIALCRQVNFNAVVFYTGDMNEFSLHQELKHIPRLRMKRVSHIEVDENLRKIVRNQSIPT